MTGANPAPAGPGFGISVATDLQACLRLRRTVFIEEQGVSEADERDEHDAAAIHLVAMRGGVPVGTARLVLQGGEGKIGRVCVLSAARGQGIGAALVLFAVGLCRRAPGVATARLGAQTHATGFYARLGFEARGPVYVDAGIDHRDMILTL